MNEYDVSWMKVISAGCRGIWMRCWKNRTGRKEHHEITKKIQNG